MYFTMKDFKEKKIAVSFKNKWEQKRFLKECEKEELEWSSGDKATKFKPNCKSCIIYNNVVKDKLGYGSKKFYKENGWQVVKFNQILFGNWKEVNRKAKVYDDGRKARGEIKKYKLKKVIVEYEHQKESE